jgi:hypothetical protein
MSGFPGNTASNASERPERRETAMNLITARRMLPLVQRIVEDILSDHKALEQLQPEQERLDRQRRDLHWPERQRRYQVHEEITGIERRLQDSFQELQKLALTLLDPKVGRIGFPTIVNDRRAYFSWRPGEETIRSWHFAEETVCRPIPPSWLKVGNISLTGKS